MDKSITGTVFADSNPPRVVPSDSITNLPIVFVAANPAASPAPTDPTASMYTALIVAWDFFNAKLFAGCLTRPMLSIRNHGNADGFFSPRRFGDVTDPAQRAGEIAINPRRIADCPVEEVMSTVVHEMCHQYQDRYGKPSRNGYHNRELAALFKSVGLHPSSTGKPGGRETGQRMSHYIIAGGAFDVACAELLTTGFELRWADVTRERERPEVERPATYICPSCDLKVRGKPDIKVRCDACNLLLLP
jgi:hypothetical protein